MMGRQASSVTWIVLLTLMVLLPDKVMGQDSVASYLTTGLPICYVTYPADSTITKEQKLDATIIIQTPHNTAEYTAKISGRGNNTWIYDKKPYNIKFDNKESLLGMTPCKKYALMANACDKSHCRIAVGFKLGEILNFEWFLQGAYVELVLNGVHQGCYYLAQRISSNTVTYDKDTGCILEYLYATQLTGDETCFLTNTNQWIIGFKDPDQPVTDGITYTNAVGRFNQLEAAVFAPDSTTDDWRDLIDWENFTKWYYWKNILQMDECNRYYVIQNNLQDTKIKMGPLWDFDWTIGMSMPPYGHYEDQYLRNKLLFQVIGKDSLFLEQVATYHFAHRDQVEESLNQLYDSLTTLLEASAQIDAQRWNLYPDSMGSWQQEIQTDRTYMSNTFSFLDQVLAPYLPTSLQECTTENTPSPYKIMYNNQIRIVDKGTQYSILGVKIR